MTDGKLPRKSQPSSSTQPAVPSPNSVPRRRYTTGSAPSCHAASRSNRRLTLYERLKCDLEHDLKVAQEVSLGKRVGFYKMKGQLGAGNFAKVKLGIHLLTHERVAVKIIDKTKLDDTSRRILSREISCMEWLDHPNIIRLYEVIESFSTLHLVMEFAGEGDLQARVLKDGPLPENQARHIFAQVASAINHMHKKGVIHRDLKAENVFFVSSTQIKVGDFGFSTQSRGQLLDTFCGSPPYAAPELFSEANYQGHLVDLWAMGVMLFYMLSGKIPFTGETIPQLKEKILAGKFNMPDYLSPVCKDLIVGLLTRDPEERHIMEDVYASLWLRTTSTSVSLGVDPTTWKDLDDCGTTSLSTKDTTQPLVPLSFSEREDPNSIDEELLEMIKEIGITISNVDDFTGEPRNPAAGTYRILHHRKLLKQLESETSMGGVDGQFSAQVNASTRTRKKSSHKLNGQHLIGSDRGQGKQKSKFCVIF